MMSDVLHELQSLLEQETAREYALEQAYARGDSFSDLLLQWEEAEYGHFTRSNDEGPSRRENGDGAEASGPLSEEGTWYEDGAGI